MTELTYQAAPGVFLKKGMCTFVTADPALKGAELLLTDKKGRVSAYPMESAGGAGSCLKTVTVKAPAAGVSYQYRIGGEIRPDPYARLLRDGRGYVPAEGAELEEDTCPSGPLTDLRIYKGHVRGMTKSLAVSDAGTFAALTGRLPAIRALGFNALELMPIYAFDPAIKGSTRINYWGYAEKNAYFSPNPAFAATDDPCAEVRTLVAEAHKIGMRLFAEFYAPDSTDPYRMWQALRYWKAAYHLDGFHVIGAGIPYSLLLADPYLRDRVLIFDSCAMDLIRQIRGSDGPAVLFENDDFRSTARGLLRGDSGQMSYFIHKTLRHPEGVIPVNDMANVNGFTLMDAVSYKEKHNEANGEHNADGPNNELTENNGAEGPTKNRRIAAMRERQVRNALAYIFLAQGVPLVMAGDESGNSQGGNNNAYSLDEPSGWVDEVKSAAAKRLTDYTKALIALRERFPILASEKPLSELMRRKTGVPEVSVHGKSAWYYDFADDSRAAGILYDGRGHGYLMVLYNANADPHTFGLPALEGVGPWQLIMTTDRPVNSVFPDDPEELEDQGTYKAAARTVTVLLCLPKEGTL